MHLLWIFCSVIYVLWYTCMYTSIKCIIIWLILVFQSNPFSWLTTQFIILQPFMNAHNKSRWFVSFFFVCDYNWIEIRNENEPFRINIRGKLYVSIRRHYSVHVVSHCQWLMSLSFIIHRSAIIIISETK